MDKAKMKLLGLALLVCVLGGCATDRASTKVEAGQSAVPATQNDANANQAKPTLATPIAASNESFDSRVGSALTSPLSDLNLVRIEIPEILLIAKKAPYAIPPAVDCAWIKAEIDALNACLGPDVDAVKYSASGDVMDKGSEELVNATVNALRSFTEGFVPFRSWVRRLTGADSHAKEVASAGIAGVIRRAFLKGIQEAKSCRLENPPPTLTLSKEPAKEPASLPIK